MPTVTYSLEPDLTPEEFIDVLVRSTLAERRHVHLFNDLNTTARHALPVDDVPLREEVVPIHDIQITFDPRYEFKAIHLEPEGKTLDFKKTADGTRLTVPRLDVHTMVVGELKGQ